MENPEQIRSMRAAFSQARHQVQSFEDKWESLHEAAQIIAGMAALAKEDYCGDLATFPAAIVQTSSTKQEIAMRGIEDLEAIIQPGLTALLAIEMRGQDTTAPAIALWREIHAARQSLLRMCPPELA